MSATNNSPEFAVAILDKLFELFKAHDVGVYDMYREIFSALARGVGSG